jgi:prophage DNA circulation protein
MSWRDQLGKVELSDGRTVIGASFRGVAFLVESAELAGGRRTVKHEYPLRDEPFVEDMGRQARAFTVEGYVLGDDYVSERDSLIDALETEGPGELRHPYFGTRRVIATSFRVRESSADGRMARVSIEFQETPAQAVNPAASSGTAEALTASADAAEEAAGASFEAAYDAADAPLVALTSLESVVEAAQESLDAALSPLVTTAQELAVLKQELEILTAETVTLVRTPASVFAALQGAISAFAVASVEGVKAVLAAIDLEPEVARPEATTTTREQERANYGALLWVFQALLVVQAVRLVADVEFDSYDAAAATRDAILDRLEDLLEDADDDAYAALQELRADLVRAVPGEEADLPRLVRYTPPSTAPSLVLAHRLYGSDALADREADLVARNGVRRPGFVPGGVELEVLADG